MITTNYYRSQIIYKDEYIQLEFDKGDIYLIKGNRSSYIVSLPLTFLERIAIHFRLFSRLLRLNVVQCISVSDNVFLLVFKSVIFNLDLSNCKIRVEHNFRKGMSRCLYLNKIVGVSGFDDMIVYGEYFQNYNHESVSIFCRSLTDVNWRKVFTFSPGLINHIHNIVADSYCIYVLTGDADSESGIWRFENNFMFYQKVLCGSQLYRCCNLFRCNEGLCYATDSPISENYLCCFHENGNLKIEKKYILNGPSIYSAMVGNNIFLSTSVEPDPRLGSIMYLLSRGKSPFIKTNTSKLYWLDKNMQLVEVFSLEKDCLPGGLFQFGNLRIVSTIINNGIIYIVLYIIGLKKYDGYSCIISITSH